MPDPLFALLLTDQMDPIYSTAHTFTDRRLWDQLISLRPEPGVSSWPVKLPSGVVVNNMSQNELDEVTVTIGSFTNDFAMALAASNAMTVIEVDDQDDSLPDTLHAAVLAAGVSPDCIYEGLYY
jgi:hypothetical protein